MHKIGDYYPVLCVRGARSLEIWGGVALSAADDLVTEKIGDGLWSILCAADSLELYEMSSLRPLLASELTESELSTNEILECAWENTRMLTPIVPDNEGFVEAECYCFESDGFVASFMLDWENWEKLHFEFGDAIYTAVVSDCFAHTGFVASEAELSEIHAGVVSDYEQIQSRANPEYYEISSDLFRLKGRYWQAVQYRDQSKPQSTLLEKNFQFLDLK